MVPADLENFSRDELVTTILKMDGELSWLKRQMFGHKSERFLPIDNGQLGLPFCGTPASEPLLGTATPVSYVRQSSTSVAPLTGHGRGQMPTHLPIVDVVIEPVDKPENTKSIGEDVSWQYEYKTGSLFIRRFIRPRYPRLDGEGIVIASLPPQVIEKGNMGPALLGYLVKQKFEHHIPLDRQRKIIMEECGIEFAESTLCDSTRQAIEFMVAVEKVFKVIVYSGLKNLDKKML